MKTLKILVVDDDEDHAEALAEVLELKGHNTRVAFTGESAVEHFRETDFDLALMDVKLPGITGVEAYIQISREHPLTEVILMSAFRLEHLLDHSLDENRVRVLHGNFSSTDLVGNLQRILPVGVLFIVGDLPEMADQLKNIAREFGIGGRIIENPDAVNHQDILESSDLLILKLNRPLFHPLKAYLSLIQGGFRGPVAILMGSPEKLAGARETDFSLRVDGCLFKPFHPEILVQTVNALADKIENRRA